MRRAEESAARSAARRFGRDTRAVSAVEFALIFPVLLIVMVAGTQLVAYINASRKVELVVDSISQMLSQAQPSANTTVATVNASDLHFSFDSALVLFPYLMKDGPRQGVQWWQDIAITFASVAFTQTSGNCAGSSDLSSCYAANVVWTSSGTSGSNYRPCTPAQLPADNTAPPSRTALPRSVFGPGSLIAVDVVFNFQPSFGARFIPAVRIARSMYVQPRYAALVNFDTTGNDGIATKCPGY